MSMRTSKSLLLVLVCTALMSATYSVLASLRGQNQRVGEPGVFDYYALSLSWAPSYCSTHPADPNECGPTKHFGFVLHGLWPQYNKNWPQFCSDEKMTKQEEDQYAPMYPSVQLMQHEWPKHGSCAGIGVAGYFDLTRTLKDAIVIPDGYQAPGSTFKTTSSDLAKAFISANPQLEEGSVLAVCSHNFLQEIHLCFDKTGVQSTACSVSETNNAHRGCGDSFRVQNVK